MSDTPQNIFEELDASGERTGRSVARLWNGQIVTSGAGHELCLSMAKEIARLRTALAEAERDRERLRGYMKAAIRATDHIRDLRGRQLWSRVGWLFGHGSGYATKLCQEFGFDPDEMPPKDSQ